MADESTTAKKETPTYHRDRLIAEAGERFGQPGFVLVGAFAMSKSQKQNFSIEETEKLVKQYLDHEVEIDHPQQEGEEE